MGFEELIQLLIALAVMFGLFSGGRKKKPAPRERRPPAPRRPPATRRPEPPPPTTVRVEIPGAPAGRQTPARPPQPTRPTVSQSPPAQPAKPAPGTLADEIYRILSGEVEVRREQSLEVDLETLERKRARPEFTPRTVEEPRTLEEITEAEAYSLETLEPAGGESHKAFHAKYIARAEGGAAPDASPAPTPQASRPFRLDAQSVRQAMVWREILGPPKGMT
jgi:hypothetical protein